MKKIILIAGPSGAGKTTISRYLQACYHIPRVVTHTTRPRRPEEVDGQSYYFETEASFARLHFFEHVKYGAFQYGSSKESLQRAWQKQDLVSLIVDIQGVKSYLAALGPQVYFLYVTVSDKEKLKRRLLARGDSLTIINKRLRGKELNALPPELKEQAHILVNDSWAKTKRTLDRIVASLR